MIRDAEYKGTFTKEIKEIIEEYLEVDFFQYLTKIRKLANLGRIQEVSISTERYTNKYDITDDNGEIVFYCEKGKVKIMEGISYKGIQATLNIGVFDDLNIEDGLYNLEELQETKKEFYEYLRDNFDGVAYVLENVLETISISLIK